MKGNNLQPVRNRGWRTVLLILLVMALTGCWDSRELDTIYIVTGVGLDVADSPEEIRLILQIGKPTQSGPDQQNSEGNMPVLLSEATNRGVAGAIEVLKRENSRTPFLHHNQVIVFGREQAERGLRNHLDAFMREHEMRMEVYVVVAETDAKEILSAVVEPERISSLSLARMFENETGTTQGCAVRLMDFISSLVEETTSPVVPVIRVMQEGEQTKLVLSSLAVFKNDRMIGRLPDNQMKGYLWLKGNMNEMPLEVETESGFANMKVFDLEVKIMPVIEAGKGAQISIKMMGKMSINELHGFTNKTMEEMTKEVAQAGIDQIKKEIIESIQVSQELNADIFGFGAELYRRYPRQWQDIKPNWDQLYPRLNYTIEVEASLVDTGKITRSLEMEVESQ